MFPIKNTRQNIEKQELTTQNENRVNNNQATRRTSHN